MARTFDLLHPVVQDKANLFIETALGAGIPIKILDTYRSPQQQDILYTQGRTTPGVPCVHAGKIKKIGSCLKHPLGLPVTNAKGGESYHNYLGPTKKHPRIEGLAFDICLIVNGQPSWDTKGDMNGNGEPDWDEVGEIGEACGLEWGGRWKSPDKPHFMDSFGLSIKDLQNGKVPLT